MDQQKQVPSQLNDDLSRDISRRRFLAGSAFAGISAALAACSGAASPSPAASSAASSAAATSPSPSTAASTAPSFNVTRPLKVLLANHTGFYAMVTPDWEKRTGAKVEFTREAFGALPLKLTPAFDSGGDSRDVAYLCRAAVALYENH